MKKAIITIITITILMTSLIVKAIVDEEKIIILEGSADSIAQIDEKLTLTAFNHSIDLMDLNYYYFQANDNSDSYYIGDVLEKTSRNSFLIAIIIYFDEQTLDFCKVNLQLYDCNSNIYYNLWSKLTIMQSARLTENAYSLNCCNDSMTVARIKASLMYYSQMQTELRKNIKTNYYPAELNDSRVSTYLSAVNIFEDYSVKKEDEQIVRDTNEVYYSYNSNSYNYDEYTNTNGIINDYVSTYFGHHTLNNGDITDDPIVQIVPKNLFFSLGQFLYIGREYGFFVNTTIDSQNSADYCVDVLVFDIVFTKNSAELNNGQGSLRITPIFQYRYRAIDRVRRNNIWNGYDQSLNQIVYSHIHYDAADYFLHDISVKHSIENEIAPNYGDTDYIPAMDYGCFFIQSRININGVGLKKYNGNFLRDFLSYAFGFVDKYGGIVNTLDFMVDLAGYGVYREEHISDSNDTIITYKINKYYQLLDYGNLLKKLNVSIHQENEKKVLFGVGNYFESVYLTSCENEEQLTRVINSIRLGVGLDNTYFYLFGMIPAGSFNPLITSTSYYSTSKAENAILGQDNDGVIEFYGDSTYYKFVPSLSGYYVAETIGNTDTFIELYESDNVPLTTDDDSGANYNARIIYYLEKDTSYYFKVKGYADSILGDYAFSINYNTYNMMSISVNTQYYLNISQQYSFILILFIPPSTSTYTFETYNTNTNPYLLLMDEYLQVFASDDNSGEGNNAKITYTLISGHPFYIMARCYEGNTGSFYFRVTND